MSIKVNHAALTNIVEQMQDTVRRMDQRLDNLEGELKQAKVEWTGQASQGFEAAKTIWNQQFYEMSMTLNTLGQRVDGANHSYQAADRRGADLFD